LALSALNAQTPAAPDLFVCGVDFFEINFGAGGGTRTRTA
jgi:hypothetical protein